ncbi:MAG: hypothetical protein COA81_04070 [Alphaproteobacteria bacterium]|nr:MAG: hypothetical protein COA81_04070 [Alphaproteobacteria bacterium]
MKYFTIALAGFFTFMAASLHAEETKVIKFGGMPAIVQQSVLLHTKKKNIIKVELIRDEGVIKYEIETINKAVGMDITFARNGEILEIEKVISFAALPEDSRAEIKKDYPGIKIQEIESVQKFYYDVEGTVDGKEIQFKVMATGDIEGESEEGDQKD